MKCKSCELEIESGFNLCPYCGTKIAKRLNTKNSNVNTYGNNNVLIGVGNDNTTTVNISSQSESDGIKYHEFISQRSNGNLDLKDKISSVVELASFSLAVYCAFFSGNKIAGVIFCGVWAGVFIATLIKHDDIKKLKKFKKTSMNNIGSYKKVAEDGRIHTITKESKCKFCNGIVRPKAIRMGKETKVYGFCSKQTFDHIFTFTPNLFSGQLVGEIERLRIYKSRVGE